MKLSTQEKMFGEDSDEKVKQIKMSENGKLSVKDFEILPQMKLKDFQQKFPNKNLVHFEASELSFNKTALKNNRISFNEILFSQPKLTLFESKMKKKRSKKTLPYELDIENIIFKNAQFDLKDFDGKQKLSVKNINASINDFLVNEETTKGKIPFSYKDYRIKTGDILFKVNEFYQLKMSELLAIKEGWRFSNFSMLPLLSRQEFSRRIKTEKDWYNIKIAETKISGIDFKFTNNQPTVNVNKIDFNHISTKTEVSKNFNAASLNFNYNTKIHFFLDIHKFIFKICKVFENKNCIFL